MVAVVEAFLVFAVAAFDLAIVTRRVGADKLVEDAKLSSSTLKKRGEIALGVGETVGELKAVVGLDTLDLHPFRAKEATTLRRKWADE